ncbi:hypothetical protein BTUL_0099g00140 [Botrytis tulipae]|uniref:Uncharacterized protein n=1 Tax=Botrytis tulipae TaxID=87230 RepID=A0A4Z1ERV9_9HELO|nr:hypothetical protein BTUL_0099g00140 [Botrytis tulipae]
MEHRPTDGSQDHMNYNTTFTSNTMDMSMLTSGFAPGAEPVAQPPDALYDRSHCAGCNALTDGTLRWKERHLDSNRDCKFPRYVTNDEHGVYVADENRFPAAGPNDDNVVFDDYGDYNAYADNAPSAAVSYDTQQSLYPQASSSAFQAQSYYPATTTGIHQGGQYSSTTGSAPQNEQYYPVSSSSSQGRGPTNEARNSGSGHHHRRGGGSSRRG